ncbi:glycosyltransferase family 2 protein [Sinimarinibacterium thermocellulolyticum]|uniref:Glycosyltransferase family 2 protein n=1 Tax=Sinimarinibacterium thermocellulolyticum TaxID=3170016 RepID=A0ABV2A6J4_9GAMM
MSARRRLSVFLIVKNEADRIDDCLASICGWADQVVVLDSGSTDGTVEIARRRGATVYQTDWPGFSAQRNRALGLVDGEWVLSIDADERVTPALRDEIDAVLSEPELDATLIKMPWRTYFFGRPLRFGRYTAPQGKLFRREGARYSTRPVHEQLLLPERRVRTLTAPLDHHSWRSYAHAQEKHLQYAMLLAQHKHAQGERASLAYACLRFFTDFIQQYVLRLGLLDGWRGFLMAVILGQYAFHKYAALRTLSEDR